MQAYRVKKKPFSHFFSFSNALFFAFSAPPFFKKAMEHTLFILKITIPIYGIVALGAWLRSKNYLRTEVEHGIMPLAVHLFFPCFVLDNMLGVEILRQGKVVAQAAGIGFGLVLISTLTCYFFGPILRLEKGSGRRTFALTSGLQNYGYVAIPLIAALFPGNQSIMAVLFTHNLGVELAVWSIGLMLISGNRSFSIRLFKNGPILAIFLGLFLSQTGLDNYVPVIFHNAFHMLGSCAIPLALLLVGSTWQSLLGKAPMSWKISLGGIFLKLVVVSAIFLCVAKYLPMSDDLRKVLIIQASLPSAMFPVILSRYYGGNTEVAIEVVLATTVASLATTPLCIILGRAWLGY